MNTQTRACGVSHPGLCGADFGLAECVRGKLARTSERHRRAWGLGVAGAPPVSGPGVSPPRKPKPRISVSELARRRR